MYHFDIFICFLFWISLGLIENLGKYRKYDFTSIRDCLRVIRNKKHHYRYVCQATTTPYIGKSQNDVDHIHPSHTSIRDCLRVIRNKKHHYMYVCQATTTPCIGKSQNDVDHIHPSHTSIRDCLRVSSNKKHHFRYVCQATTTLYFNKIGVVFLLKKYHLHIFFLANLLCLAIFLDFYFFTGICRKISKVNWELYQLDF